MPNNRAKAFEEVTRMYGTINRQPPDSRRPQYNFRVGGGGSSISHVPQAGSFQHLKELIRTERARELQVLFFFYFFRSTIYNSFFFFYK